MPSPLITVRVASPEDAASVSGILQDSYPALMASAYDPALLEQVLPLIVHAKLSLLETGRYHIAAAQSGLAVGCGGWTHEAPGTGERQNGVAHLRHFGTRAGWAGQGIGRAVYASCERQARQESVERFVCYSNLNAVGFYRNLGFEAVEERQIPMGKNLVLPAMVMHLALESRKRTA